MTGPTISPACTHHIHSNPESRPSVDDAVQTSQKPGGRGGGTPGGMKVANFSATRQRRCQVCRHPKHVTGISPVTRLLCAGATLPLLKRCWRHLGHFCSRYWWSSQSRLQRHGHCHTDEEQQEWWEPGAAVEGSDVPAVATDACSTRYTCIFGGANTHC